MTRSRKKLDLQAIEQLAFVGCSVKEIAVYLGREEAELRSRRCLRALTKGRISFSIILRRRMFELAVGGNIPLLMFLHNNPQPLNELRYQYEDLTHEQLIEQMKRSYEKAGAELRRVGYFQPTGTVVATMEACQPGGPER
jgi:hypothetical protein